MLDILSDVPRRGAFVFTGASRVHWRTWVASRLRSTRLQPSRAGGCTTCAGPYTIGLAQLGVVHEIAEDDHRAHAAGAVQRYNRHEYPEEKRRPSALGRPRHGDRQGRPRQGVADKAVGGGAGDAHGIGFLIGEDRECNLTRLAPHRPSPVDILRSPCGGHRCTAPYPSGI